MDLTTQLSKFFSDLLGGVLGQNVTFGAVSTLQSFSGSTSIPTGQNVMMNGPSVILTGSLIVLGTSKLRIL